MKRVFMNILALAIICAVNVMSISAMTEFRPRHDFESLYASLATDLESDNDRVDAMIMVDLNSDSIPELFTLSSCGEDEYQKQKLLLERGYYVDIMEQYSIGTERTQDEIRESSPWRDENDAIPVENRITMHKLPGEDYRYDTETFVHFRANPINDCYSCLSIYNVDAKKGETGGNALYEIWFDYSNFYSDENGETYTISGEKHDYRLYVDDEFLEILNSQTSTKHHVPEYIVDSKEYTDKYVDGYISSDAPYACIRLCDLETGERITVSEAMSKLIEDFVAADKATINSSNWAKEEIYQARRMGLIDSYMYGWDMNENITREEFAALLASIDNFRSDLYPSCIIGRVKIIDISDSPYYAHISYVCDEGYMEGTYYDEEKKGTIFSPKMEITREQMSEMIYRMNENKFKEYDKKAKPIVLDEKEISDYAKDYMFALNSFGILKGKDMITGYRNNDPVKYRFSPKDTATRQEAVALSLRTLKLFVGTEIDYYRIINGGSVLNAYWIVDHID